MEGFIRPVQTGRSSMGSMARCSQVGAPCFDENCQNLRKAKETVMATGIVSRIPKKTRFCQRCPSCFTLLRCVAVTSEIRFSSTLQSSFLNVGFQGLRDNSSKHLRPKTKTTQQKQQNTRPKPQISKPLHPLCKCRSSFHFQPKVP